MNLDTMTACHQTLTVEISGTSRKNQGCDVACARDKNRLLFWNDQFLTQRRSIKFVLNRQIISTKKISNCFEPYF